MTTARCPLHIIGEAAVVHRASIPVVGECCPKATTRFADHLDGEPASWTLHIADADIEIANDLRLIKCGAHERIHLPRWINLGEPVKLWTNAESREGGEEERLNKVARVVLRRGTCWCRNAGERHPHVLLYGVRGEERLCIHCVHVFHAVTELHWDAPCA